MASSKKQHIQDHAAKIARAEEILDYNFKNKGLLQDALTHPSAIDKRKMRHDYERLEFLGDSILGAVTAVYLFNAFSDLDEGGLTRIKVSLVSGSSLSQVAQEAGLASCIIFGESETGTEGRGLHSALENVYESIVAALYLDGGIEAARAWISRSLLTRADKDLAYEPESPKSSLQELLQMKGQQPEYRIVNMEGPPHERTFYAEVSVDGKVLGSGSGRSKKLAESAAASEALQKLT